MAAYTPTFDFQVAIEKCELCQEEDAQFYCTYCQEEMCNSCKTVHLRSKLSRDHTVVSTSLGTSDRKTREPIKCTAHQREIIRMYCASCDEAVCLKCATSIKHKNHNFEELETTLYKYQDEISQSVKETKQQIEELQKSLHTIDVNVKDYTEVSDQTIKEINQQRNQIKSNVDKIADDLIHQVEKQKQQDLQLMEKEKKDTQKIITDHNKHLQSCEEKSNSMKNFNEIQHQIKSRNTKVPSFTHINPPSFVSDATLNLQNIFGKLTDSLESTSTQKASEKGKQQKAKMKLDVRRNSSSSITTISTDIVSKINHDVKCECVSAVNDKEAWCGENNLVLIDIHGHVKKKIELKNTLWAVVVTTAGDLFITDYDGKNIIKYSTDGKHTKIGNTKPYRTRGLCNTSVPDNILVCLCNNDGDSKVVRMTTEGHIKQTIQKNKQQKSLYKNPRYVAENINEDVVVADSWSPSTIVVVNKRGEYRYTYPDLLQLSDTIGRCDGIACDNIGCILVSDFGNHRIHQIDMNGRFIQFVLTLQHGIPCTQGMSIDNKGQLWLCNKIGKEVTIFKYKS